MNDMVKKVLYIIGAITGVYIFLRYILPLILKLLGFVLGAVLSVILWGITGLAVLFLVVYVTRLVRNSH